MATDATLCVCVRAKPYIQSMRHLLLTCVCARVWCVCMCVSVAICMCTRMYVVYVCGRDSYELRPVRKTQGE